LKYLKIYLISLIIVVADQVFKLWVHNNMFLGEEISVVGDWFKLHYVLNPGFAYGLKIDAEWGKLLLSTFRILATGFIFWYIFKLISQKAKTGLLICLALVLGGALGNLIDSVFYGVYLNNAPAGSPSPWLHGQVIDMLYFPLWAGFLPDWVPFKGGDYFIFFRPVFNIADAAVFTGFLFILFFQKRFFPEATKTEDVEEITLTSDESPFEGPEEESLNNDDLPDADTQADDEKPVV
jgi:signal peptidase II